MKKEAFAVLALSMFLLSLVSPVLAIGSPQGAEVTAVNAALDNMTICANITLAKKPYCIAINAETNRVYVGVDNGLVVIHGDTNQVISEIPLGVSNYVAALAVNPLTNRIYAGIWGGNVIVIDGATNLKVGEIPARSLYDSYNLAVNPVTNRVYIAQRAIYVGEDSSVRIYNGETLQFVTSVALGTTPYFETVGVAVNPSTNKVYAAWSGNNSLFMIDGNSNQIMKNAVPAYFSELIMVNSNTSHVYSGTTVLNGDTLEQVTPGLNNEIAAVDPIHNHLYTAAYNNNLSRLDGSTRSIIGSVKLYQTYYLNSDRTAVNSKTAKVYVVHGGGNGVVVIPEFPLMMPITLAILVLGAAISAFKRGMFRTKHASATETT